MRRLPVLALLSTICLFSFISESASGIGPSDTTNPEAAPAASTAIETKAAGTAPSNGEADAPEQTGSATELAEYDVETIDGVAWTTNKEFPQIGDKRATKGGEFRVRIERYLPTLREHGPSANLTTITDIYGLTHETLLGMHPETLEWIPSLATHWTVSDDKKVFTFKLNPNAKFSNGKALTADDVVATYDFMVNPDVKDPAIRKLFLDYYERPEKLGEHVVRVKAKVLSWRAMLYFAGSMKIYSADDMKIPGEIYLKDYNWKPYVGTGPYIIANPETDLKQDVSITLTRRDDYWAKDDPVSQYTGNFDKLHFVVVRDDELAFKKLKEGELDYYLIGRAQRWVQETDFDQVQKGWIQKRKVYNEVPQSFSGYMFNMREWPFDDKNVRLAFCYGFNRKELFERLFFNQYEYIDSYFPGGMWEGDNRPIRYLPDRANRMLDRAGYTKRDADGIRVHAETGKRLEFTLLFGTPSFERIHRLIAEDLKKIGMQMNLELFEYNSLVKRIGERKFKLHFQSWRGIIYPNPITSWHSDLANKPDNNNLTGFANAKVDALMEEYDKTFDRKRQIEIVREIDSIIYKEYTTALGWFGPYQRILFWNRYGMPDTVLTRYTDTRALWSNWWFDAEKAQRLEDAMAKGGMLPVGETVVDPWGVKARLDARNAAKKTEQ